MRELSLRHRVRWLIPPVIALAVGCALIEPLRDPEYWAETARVGTFAIFGIFAVGFAVPAAILLATVRTVGCWAVGVLALTGAALWLPIAFALDESSTRGLAFIVPVFYGVPASVLLAIVDRAVRSPSRDRAPAARR